MNKITKYLLFAYLLTFLFIFNVKAECSYQERKDLLNEAKSVDVSVEPIEVSAENGKFDFKFNITGLTNNLFIKYYNTNNGIENFITSNNLNNGIYSFIDENSLLVYDYKFIFYSNNNNCPGYELTTKTIKKPMYNTYSENSNCELEKNSDFLYCRKFLEKNYNLSLEQFNIAITDYELKKAENIEIEENNTTIKNTIIISILITIVLFIAIYVIYLIKKKNRKL